VKHFLFAYIKKNTTFAANLRKEVCMTDDPTCMSEEEFFARVDEAREDIRQGKGIKMQANESLDDLIFLNTNNNSI